MSRTSQETQFLYSSLGADPDLAEIVEEFVAEMPQRVSEMLEHVKASDWESLRRAAHQLKGAAGSYGFEAITPCAARLEGRIHDEEPEAEIRVAVDELVDLCRRARAGAGNDE